MPSYHTHSILAERVYPDLEKYTDIDKETLKTFAIGPDALISTDNKTFKNLHKQDVKTYYETLIKEYKESKLLDNPEAMAFLYGQLCHFMLDVSTHPLIYYLTEKYPKDYKIGPHGIVEMWIDGYYKKMYGDDKTFYYKKTSIKDKELRKVIDEVTNRVYSSNNASRNYTNGIKILAAYDSLARNNLLGFVPLLESTLGPITFKNGNKYVEPFLNLDHEEWVDPETGVKSIETFDELFKKAGVMTEEIVHDVNQTLYNDKPLKNFYIVNNISYNTAINCDYGQTFLYCKEYPLMDAIKKSFDNIDKKARKEFDEGLFKAFIIAAPIIATYMSTVLTQDGSFDENKLLISTSGLLGVSIYDAIKKQKEINKLMDGSPRTRK